MSNTSVPGPPWQCPMPGTMNSASEFAADGPDRFVDPLEHDQARVGRDQRIGPAVIHQQLAAAVEEARQIRIAAVQQSVVRPDRALDIVGHIDRVVVPVGREDDLLHALRAIRRTAPARRRRPIRAPIPDSSGPDAARRRSVDRRSATSSPSRSRPAASSGNRRDPLRCTSASRSRSEHRAGSSITPSFTPSSGVARVQHGVVDHRVLARRNHRRRLAVDVDVQPHARRIEPHLVPRRIAGDDAVEIVRDSAAPRSAPAVRPSSTS